MSAFLMLMMLAQDVPLAAVTVPDAELAAQRGGFQLPSGIDVALTVQTQTSINGAIVLRSVFSVDQGPATLSVYAPKVGETVASGASTAVRSSSASAAPTITYDNRGTIQIVPAGGGPGAAIMTGAHSLDPVPAGLELVQAGTRAITDNGVVSQDNRSGIQTAELSAPDLSVIHLAGNAFGSAISNSLNDRAIDTQTTVGIDLRNAGPDVLGSAMLRVEDVATNALQFRP